MWKYSGIHTSLSPPLHQKQYWTAFLSHSINSNDLDEKNPGDQDGKEGWVRSCNLDILLCELTKSLTYGLNHVCRNICLFCGVQISVQFNKPQSASTISCHSQILTEKNTFRGSIPRLLFCTLPYCQWLNTIQQCMAVIPPLTVQTWYFLHPPQPSFGG